MLGFGDFKITSSWHLSKLSDEYKADLVFVLLAGNDETSKILGGKEKSGIVLQLDELNVMSSKLNILEVK